jgi:polar amino acid transport system ATP-binding protein
MKLEAHSVNKSYGSGKERRTVLRDLTVTADFPHVLALLGPSGGGKSTLLRVIAGLERPDSGAIRLDDRPVPFGSPGEAALRDYRRSLGVVFQAYNLFPHRNALQNVMLPLTAAHGLAPGEARERSIEVLSRLGLADHALKSPSQLSGGQRQRVAIARALATKPRFLLLDEPTSALDPEMTAEVLEVIAELKESRTPMLLITHEMGFARRVADRIAFLADGRLLEEGPAEAFFDHPITAEARHFLSKVLAY